jgi:hypothetical protein
MFSFRETRKPPNHIRKRIIFDAFGVWTGLQILCTFSYRTRFPPPETASDTRPSSGARAHLASPLGRMETPAVVGVVMGFLR